MKKPVGMEYIVHEEMMDDINLIVSKLVEWMGQEEFGNATIHWAQHKPKKLERTEKVLIN